VIVLYHKQQSYDRLVSILSLRANKAFAAGWPGQPWHYARLQRGVSPLSIFAGLQYLLQLFHMHSDKKAP
jgi:hypothetical protein